MTLDELAAEKVLKAVAAWHPPLAVKLVHIEPSSWRRPICSMGMILEIDAPKYFNRELLADTVTDLRKAQSPEVYETLYYNDGSISETEHRTYSRFGFIGVTWGRVIVEEPPSTKRRQAPPRKKTREELNFAPSLLRFSLGVEYADVMKALDEGTQAKHKIVNELMLFLEQWGWEPKVYAGPPLHPLMAIAPEVG